MRELVVNNAVGKLQLQYNDANQHNDVMQYGDVIGFTVLDHTMMRGCWCQQDKFVVDWTSKTD